MENWLANTKYGLTTFQKMWSKCGQSAKKAYLDLFGRDTLIFAVSKKTTQLLRICLP
jgi:hypothetical protein